MTRATSDRHTGRAARNAALRRLRKAREKAEREADQLGLLTNATTSPAGSRDETCRPPLQGGGGGSEPGSAAASDGGPFFPRYSETNYPKPPGASAAETRDQATTEPRTFGLTDLPEWDAAVASATEPFRDARARHFRARARQAQAEGDRGRADWNAARAGGQEERPQRVAVCGSEEVSIRCNSCSHEETQLVLRCGQWRLCRECRARRAYRYQAMFRAGRAELLASRYRLRQFTAPGGRWGERFTTLTLPHSGDIRADIEVLPQLWKRFQRFVYEYLERDVKVPRELRAFPYVRVVEVTPGEDLLGHAHIHAWMFTPFIPHEFLRMWWGRALQLHDYDVPTRPLEDVLAPTAGFRRTQLAGGLVTRRGRAGRPLAEVPWPVVDVRACHGDVEREFIKYLVKDAERSPDGELTFMDPQLFARVYEGLEGIRTIQASRNFWSKEALETGIRACSECGETDLATRRVKREQTAGGDGEGD